MYIEGPIRRTWYRNVRVECNVNLLLYCCSKPFRTFFTALFTTLLYCRVVLCSNVVHSSRPFTGRYSLRESPNLEAVDHARGTAGGIATDGDEGWCEGGDPDVVVAGGGCRVQRKADVCVIVWRPRMGDG